MAFKLVTIFALIAAASAGLLPAAQVYQAAPALVKAAPIAVAQPVLAKSAEEYDPHPQYNYAYDIQDALSGDSKSQIESRDGDVVKGQYSLIDADGFKRTVDYTADPINGFNAVVSREPLAVKAAVAAPVAYSAPALIKSAPVAYSAAPAPIAYSAPALIKSAPIAYSSPALYKSAPIAYSSPAYLKAAPFAYAH